MVTGRQHFDAIVRDASGERRVRLDATTLYDARLKARDLDLVPLAFEHVVDGLTVARAR